MFKDRLILQRRALCAQSGLMTTALELSVDAMDCGNCAMRIETEPKRVPSESAIDADFAWDA